MANSILKAKASIMHPHIWLGRLNHCNYVQTGQRLLVAT